MIRIKEENHWLRQFQAKEGIDIVISDNRYGLWRRDLYCVLITHQLNIHTGLGAWADRWIRQWHYRLIDRFDTCWVPDITSGTGLAGALSHPARLPRVPTHYIGLLSRMERSMADETIDLLVLLSGPEPQRSILEKMLWEQLQSFKGSFVFVRGLPGGGSPLSGTNVYDHLPASALNKLLVRARMVVARSGYSTVMDLVRLQKRSILIPTPGQTEQEYLGKYLTAQRIALCIRQSGFFLEDALQRAEQFSYITLQEEEHLLRDVLDQSFSPKRLG
ncbi:MAG TPA: glycosyltransferase [Puia sp.]|nr:glycosyltransferase [Puia sp.]